MLGRGIAMLMGKRWSRSRGTFMAGGLLVILRGGLRGGRGLGGGRGGEGGVLGRGGGDVIGICGLGGRLVGVGI